METRLSLTRGQNGTKKLLARYGDRLILACATATIPSAASATKQSS